MMFAKGEAEAAALAPFREWGSCKIGMSVSETADGGSYRTEHMSTSISACKVCIVWGNLIGCVIRKRGAFFNIEKPFTSSSAASHISALIVLVHHSAAASKGGQERFAPVFPSLIPLK